MDNGTMKALILTVVAIWVAGLLGACATTPAGSDEEEARLHALLSANADKGIRCLSVTQYDSVQILGDRTLLFKGRGKKVWANELTSPCPGMHKDDVLIFDLRGSQVCSLDWVTPTRPGWLHAGPKCSLGEFIEFDPEVLEAVNKGLPKL